MMDEGIQAVAWVAVEPTPVPHVKDVLPASMFYGNKILVEFKGKDQKHIDWVNASMVIEKAFVFPCRVPHGFASGSN